jgi:hypothetical protein
MTIKRHVTWPDEPNADLSNSCRPSRPEGARQALRTCPLILTGRYDKISRVLTRGTFELTTRSHKSLYLSRSAVTQGYELTDQVIYDHRVVYCVSDCSGKRKHDCPVKLSSNGRLYTRLDERILVTPDTRPPVGA